MTRDELRMMVADQLGLDPASLGDRDNLVELGLESIAIMRMINSWRRNGQVPRYSDLVDDATVEGWWELLSALRS